MVYLATAHVQHAVPGDAIGGLAPGHLNEASEGRSLEGQAQLGRRRLHRLWGKWENHG